MTWLLPKSAYAQPIVTLGSAAVVGTDATNWLVIANGGTSLKFTSAKVQ
ncbi:putative outer membrane protein [Burkholderia pseudomallei]|nr:putative outer membrane protein [Burkholderia pseudomallei]